eukprot:8116009-Pyramimonas_sp.AAC.1
MSPGASWGASEGLGHLESLFGRLRAVLQGSRAVLGSILLGSFWGPLGPPCGPRRGFRGHLEDVLEATGAALG